MMKRKFVCTKEMPLSEQVDVNEQTEISDIVVSGYLGGKDLMLLSNMSQGGNLLKLDMSGVTEFRILMAWMEQLKVLRFVMIMDSKRSIFRILTSLSILCSIIAQI